jgi:hypothetical protein
MRTILILLCASIIGFSCTKHKGDIEDQVPVASLSFIAPAINKSYQQGDTVNVQALAISTASIHGYDLIIKKQTDTTTCYFLHVHEHNDTIRINKNWINNVSGGHKMDAFIKLYLDHDGHTLTGKASFSVD